MKRIVIIVVALALAGCGTMQKYHQYLDNNQRTFERQQNILEAQNRVQVAKLSVLAAQQEAQVNIAIAKGKAQAQEIQTRSLRPIFIQQELVDAIQAGKVQTMVLPASTMLPLNLQSAVGSNNAPAQAERQ